jgi:putative Holliday junction resolvase
MREEHGSAVPSRVIAFDWGVKRIGWAISDPLRLFAQSGGHLERSGESYPWRALIELVVTHEAGALVVGDPVGLEGESTNSSDAARTFAAELARRTALPVALHDERGTSADAESRVRPVRRSAGRPARAGRAARARRRADVDRVAALLILQSWLEEHGPRTERK